MALLSTSSGYGALAKLLHWTVVVLFAFQYVAAAHMLRLDSRGAALGLSKDDWYDWHKSVGLLALAIAVVRLAVRHCGRLPDWAPQLTPWEQRFIHRAEQVLYASMVLMPVSGFLFVMAGGYGVRLFGRFDLASPIGQSDLVAHIFEWVHLTCAILLSAAIAGHVGLVLRHQLLLRNGLLLRMLPRRPYR